MPFNTSSTKQYKHKEELPGPGYYNHPTQFKNPPDTTNSYIQNVISSLNLKKIGFDASTQRFSNENEETTVGPGSYEQVYGDRGIKRRHASEGSKHSIAPKKSLNPPSIPSHKLTFGYSDKNGEIIPQPNPDDTYTGEKKDMVLLIIKIGPGHYDIKRITRKRGISWNVEQTQPKHKKPQDNDMIGPGSYDIACPNFTNKKDTKFIIPIRKEVPMDKSISSNSDYEDEDEGSPGPGYYKSVDSSFKASTIPLEKQNFGSKAERFSKIKPHVSEKIGPGAYTTEASQLQNQKFKKNYSVFKSENVRFPYKIPNDIPGPGAYDCQAITRPKSKTVSAKKQGPFNSSEKRFVEVFTTQDIPGPGDYQPLECLKKLEGMKNSNIKKSSSMFVTPHRLKREPRKEMLPGDYSYQCNTISVSLKKSILKSHIKDVLNKLRSKATDLATFVSKSRFIKGHDYKSTLGPGSYEINRDFDGTTVSNNGVIEKVLFLTRQRGLAH